MTSLEWFTADLLGQLPTLTDQSGRCTHFQNDACQLAVRSVGFWMQYLTDQYKHGSPSDNRVQDRGAVGPGRQ